MNDSNNGNGSDNAHDQGAHKMGGPACEGIMYCSECYNSLQIDLALEALQAVKGLYNALPEIEATADFTQGMSGEQKLELTQRVLDRSVQLELSHQLNCLREAVMVCAAEINDMNGHMARIMNIGEIVDTE